MRFFARELSGFGARVAQTYLKLRAIGLVHMCAIGTRRKSDIKRCAEGLRSDGSSSGKVAGEHVEVPYFRADGGRDSRFCGAGQPV